MNFDPASLGFASIEDITHLPLDSLQEHIDNRENEDFLSRHTRLERQNRRSVATTIMNRLRISIQHYLMQVERTLRMSVTGERVFEDHRRRVETRLTQVAPEILDQLNSAIRRSRELNDTESRAQALLSCRRVLVAVADIVFPARNEAHVDGGGREREVGQNQYRNRLIAFIETLDQGALNSALIGTTAEFATRLDSLDNLTQVGVHGTASAEAVDFGVIQTYLLAGEILGLS
jgi:hypothetical protein